MAEQYPTGPTTAVGATVTAVTDPAAGTGADALAGTGAARWPSASDGGRSRCTRSPSTPSTA